MKAPTISSSDDLEASYPEHAQKWMGQGSQTIDRVSIPERAGPGSLVFASTAEQLAKAMEQKASVIVASAKLTPAANPAPQTVLLKSPHVGLAMSAILPHFDRKKDRFEKGRHPQSSVASSAKVGSGVSIGAFAVIGEECVIGDGVKIGANVVIERGAQVGARTVLHPSVFIGGDCLVGEDCEIHPHTTIGSDGFGYAQDKEGRHHKLPQIGRVVLEDRVEIGANCAIDRAAFHETRIRAGAKLDNLCHIAHNCDIGEDSAIAGGFMMAGSTTLGRKFMTGGNSVVADHLVICDNVMLSGRSTVTNDIKEPGAYGGYPLLPMKTYLKNLASSVHVLEMRKNLSKVMKHLGLKEEEK